MYHDSISQRMLTALQVEALVNNHIPINVASAFATLDMSVSAAGAGFECIPDKKDFLFRTNSPIQTIQFFMPPKVFLPDRPGVPRFHILRFECKVEANKKHVDKVVYRDPNIPEGAPDHQGWQALQDIYESVKVPARLVRIVFKMSGKDKTAPFEFDVFAKDLMQGGVPELRCDPQVGNEPPNANDPGAPGGG
ncbi:MAG: hypothetical protein E6Q88_04465 [Lysobacteraceae bacterium]|nr:MAG: hypothetical protein E6Q88_04465 [Xanthomonadaceae bacterium]